MDANITHYNNIETMIHAGCDVNAQNILGETILMLIDNIEIAKLLIDNGADINTRNIYGKTALMYINNADVAKLLIAKINA